MSRHCVTVTPPQTSALVSTVKSPTPHCVTVLLSDKTLFRFPFQGAKLSEALSKFFFFTHFSSTDVDLVHLDV